MKRKKLIITVFLMALFTQERYLHACNGYGRLGFLSAGYSKSSEKHDKAIKQYNNFYAAIRDTKDFKKLERYNTDNLGELDANDLVYTKGKGYVLASWPKTLVYELIKNAKEIFGYHEIIDIYFSSTRKRDIIPNKINGKYYKVYYKDPSIEEKTIIRQLSTEIFNLNIEEESLLTIRSAFTQEDWRIYSRQQREKQIKLEIEREKREKEREEERLRLKNEREEKTRRLEEEKMEKEWELRRYCITEPTFDPPPFIAEMLRANIGRNPDGTIYIKQED